MAMNVQFIETKGGRLVVMPESEFRALVEAAADAEDTAVVERFRERLARGEEELVPADIANRLLAGENPVRVWREHRGMTARALAEAADIAAPYLSQIESGHREGSFDTMRKLAAALKISLDDLT
jgi:DNA-binding XRE family transcriptional regulator